MNDAHRARVDDLLADYRASREQLADVHRKLAQISESAGSADGSVKVTVGPRGTLTHLALSEAVYRNYQPAELAEEIVRLTAVATVRALADAGEVLAPALPVDTDPQALLLGTADLAPEEIASAAEAQEADDDDDFESADWLRSDWSGSR